MGKKRERVFKPKKTIYKYVTYTDENGILQQAFEELPQHGITQNRVIPLGQVPKDENSDNYHENSGSNPDYECSQSMDEDEKMFLNSFLKQPEAPKPEAVHNYEVELPSPEISLHVEFSENSYIDDDKNFEIDLRRPVATDNEFVKELPISSNKIISATKKAKEFLLDQLFGNVEYEETDIEDAPELLEKALAEQADAGKLNEEEELEMKENIDFFKQDFQRGQDRCSDSEGVGGCEDSGYSDEIDEEDVFDEFYDEERVEIKQEDLNVPVANQDDVEEYCQKFDANDESWKDYYKQLSEPKQQISTLEQKTKSVVSQQIRTVQADQMIIVSKKTGKIVQNEQEKELEQEVDGVELVTVVLPQYRNKQESEEERKLRKQEIKDAKMLRRKNNEIVKEMILEEKTRINTAHQRNKGNIQGRSIQ